MAPYWYFSSSGNRFCGIEKRMYKVIWNLGWGWNMTCITLELWIALELNHEFCLLFQCCSAIQFIAGNPSFWWVGSEIIFLGKSWLYFEIKAIHSVSSIFPSDATSCSTDSFPKGAGNQIHSKLQLLRGRNTGRNQSSSSPLSTKWQPNLAVDKEFKNVLSDMYASNYTIVP